MVKKRIRVLMSAYACEPNKGSEPGVGWNWATQMAKYNDVYVITRSNNKEVIESYLKEFPIKNLYFFYYDCNNLKKKIKKLPNGIFVYYKIWQKEILPLAEKIVKKYKIDIVHHVTFNEYRTPGKLYKLPVPFVWGPIGGGQFYNPIFKEAFFNKRDVLKERLRNCINRSCLLFSRDFRVAVQQSEVIMVADQSTQKIMPKSRKYVRLLETGYNVEKNNAKVFSESEKNKLDRPIQLLWVGGIWPRKGLKLLIDALHDTTFTNYHLRIVGDGQDKNNVEKLVEQYELSSKVEFLGSLDYKNVNKIYEKADVFLFTSLRDTSGNVVLEAMSHGLPVIAINHHGVGEIVTDKTGILIEPRTYDFLKKGFVDAIKRYAEDYQLIKTHGCAGRHRIEEKYSWEKNAQVLQGIYEEIVRKSFSD